MNKDASITYQIIDWDVHFENSKSRERERCSFCCIPNKQDGLGYGMLMSEPDGESLYGAFVAVVLIASKQKKRKGYLTATGLPHDCPLSARQLSVKCRFKDTTIQRMLEVCSTPEIGWIIKHIGLFSNGADEVPAECPPSALEGKGKKEGREGIPLEKLSPADVVKYDNELKRLVKELDGLGKLSDYAKGSKSWNRINELNQRKSELKKLLGVVV